MKPKDLRNKRIWYPFPKNLPPENGEYIVTGASKVPRDIVFVSRERYEDGKWIQISENVDDHLDISSCINAWMFIPDDIRKK